MTAAGITYRFTHENHSRWRRAQFDGSSISLADLKVLVAQQDGLQKEFARKFDLRVFYAKSDDGSKARRNGWTNRVGSMSGNDGGEGVGEEVLLDSERLPAGSRVMVQRHRWVEIEELRHNVADAYQQDAALVHDANYSSKNMSSINNGEATASSKPAFPAEYLCALCTYVLENGMVVRCMSNCKGSEHSACRSCVDMRMKANGGFCPFCEDLGARSRVKNVISNKAIGRIMKGLRYEDYACVPRRPSTTADSKGLADNGGVVKQESSANGTSDIPVKQQGVKSELKTELHPVKDEPADATSLVEHTDAVLDDTGASADASNNNTGNDIAVAMVCKEEQRDTTNSKGDAIYSDLTIGIKASGMDCAPTAAVEVPHHLVIMLHPSNLRLLHEHGRMVLNLESNLGKAFTARNAMTTALKSEASSMQSRSGGDATAESCCSSTTVTTGDADDDCGAVCDTAKQHACALSLSGEDRSVCVQPLSVIGGVQNGGNCNVDNNNNKNKQLCASMHPEGVLSSAPIVTIGSDTTFRNNSALVQNCNVVTTVSSTLPSDSSSISLASELCSSGLPVRKLHRPNEASGQHRPFEFGRDFVCLLAAVAGSGTSVMVGGTCRLTALDWLANADMSAATVLSQWQHSSSNNTPSGNSRNGSDNYNNGGSSYRSSSNGSHSDDPSVNSSNSSNNNRCVVALEWIDKLPSLICLPAKCQVVLNVTKYNSRLQLSSRQLDDFECENPEESVTQLLTYAKEYAIKGGAFGFQQTPRLPPTSTATGSNILQNSNILPTGAHPPAPPPPQHPYNHHHLQMHQSSIAMGVQQHQSHQRYSNMYPRSATADPAILQPQQQYEVHPSLRSSAVIPGMVPPLNNHVLPVPVSCSSDGAINPHAVRPDDSCSGMAMTSSGQTSIHTQQQQQQQNQTYPDLEFRQSNLQPPPPPSGVIPHTGLSNDSGRTVNETQTATQKTSMLPEGLPDVESRDAGNSPANNTLDVSGRISPSPRLSDAGQSDCTANGDRNTPGPSGNSSGADFMSSGKRRKVCEAGGMVGGATTAVHSLQKSKSMRYLAQIAKSAASSFPLMSESEFAELQTLQRFIFTHRQQIIANACSPQNSTHHGVIADTNGHTGDVHQ
eukprot:Lankesteria_metandrocarpae@DN923_c0_g1_i1.p1